MNKYQNVFAQIVKDDKAKGHHESFRSMRIDYREVLKSYVFEDLVDFKNYNKKLPI